MSNSDSPGKIAPLKAYKVDATLIEDGTLVLEGLPFYAGDSVEVIILEHSKKQPQSESDLPPGQYPLQENQTYPNDDPFEPAVPAEDWEVLN